MSSFLSSKNVIEKMIVYTLVAERTVVQYEQHIGVDARNLLSLNEEVWPF